MDVITTTLAEKIVEKNIKDQKRCPRKKNKKRRNRLNQNVEISSKENCHRIAEAGACVGQGVDLEKSSQVDRAHAEEIVGKNKTRYRKLNEMKNFVNPTNQNIETSSNEKCHVDEGGSYNGLAVESLLRGSSQEDIAPNDTIENKRTSFKDELVLELSQGERVLSDAVKEHSHNKTKKRKRKPKSKGLSNNELEPMEIENKCLEISVDNSCISATELGIKDVKLIVEPMLQESAEVDKVSTEIVKEKQDPERKKRKKRRKKAKARNKDGKAILDEEDKCLKISVDSKSCIAAAESGINGVDLTVESVLQESLKVEEVSTEIAKENKIPEGKRKSKRKSKARKTDGNASLDEEVKCLMVSVDGESCITAADLGTTGVDSTVESLLPEAPVVEEISTEIVQKQNTPNRKQRKKKKSKDRDIDEKVILGEEAKCMKISVESNGGIVAAESGINHVDSTLEPLPQESPKVEEDSTEIVLKQNTQEVKQKRKRKSKERDKGEKVILGEEDKGLKISVESNSGIAAAESGINHVDSTFEPLPQELPKVKEVSTEIAKNQKTAEEKRRRKKKSKDKDKDEKVILKKEEDKCLKVSVESNSGIAAAELGIKGVNEIVEPPLLQVSPKVEEVSTKIAKKQKTSEEKQRRKRKSKDTDKNGKGILGEADKCLKISADRKSCVAAAESTIKDVDSNVESLLQDFAVVDEASTDIVEEKKGTKGKKRQRRKLKIKSENKVEEPILEQQDELLVTSIDGKCCTKIEMGTLQGVDSRSKCPSDNDSSLVSNGMVDLSNGLFHLPQRAGTTCSRRILLILDINGLLADIVMPPPKERKSDINMLGRAIFKRPYCDDFLNFCFDTFDVGIWSSRTKRVIDKVVDYLLGKRKQELLFCWDMSHTTVSKFKTLENRYKPLVCKSLRNLWEKRDPALPWEKGDYTESNTLLIDDSPYKALLNPMHTAIFPYSFTYKDLHDNALGPGGKIRVYLENLAKTDDVRTYVEQHPFGQPAITEKSSSWDFYSKVVSSLSRF